ncbi:hypothetical protein M758_UG125200 [Ceratodon purpureus]|nr:hypothetical protein M758_UG125200 [Ceratodon purpureus]
MRPPLNSLDCLPIICLSFSLLFCRHADPANLNTSNNTREFGALQADSQTSLGNQLQHDQPKQVQPQQPTPTPACYPPQGCNATKT